MQNMLHDCILNQKKKSIGQQVKFEALYIVYIIKSIDYD